MYKANSLDPMSRRSGILFLVVGPSGVGKDSLIDGARAEFDGNPRYVFPRRIITRAADAGGEDHRSIAEGDFEAEEAAGAFAFSWQAHGLAYAIPKTIEDDLAAGRSLIINVSRSTLDQARHRFPNLRVVSIHAPREILVERLAKRGRESEADVQKRLDRAMAYDVRGSDVIEFVNDGSLEIAIDRFVGILRETAQPPN
jgi:ribose 1,5-bisphosphokinase